MLRNIINNKFNKFKIVEVKVNVEKIQIAKFNKKPE